MKELLKVENGYKTPNTENYKSVVSRLFFVWILLVTVSAWWLFALNTYKFDQKVFSSLGDKVLEVNDRILNIEKIVSWLTAVYDKSLTENYNESQDIIKKIADLELENESLKDVNYKNLENLDKKINNLLAKIDKIEQSSLAIKWRNIKEVKPDTSALLNMRKKADIEEIRLLSSKIKWPSDAIKIVKSHTLSKETKSDKNKVWINRNVIKDRISLKNDNDNKSKVIKNNISNITYLFPHNKDSLPLINLLDLPSNLSRIAVDKWSYNDWMRYIPTKKANSWIFNYLKELMFPPDFAHAIIDIETKKFQECADIAMRMWSEYLFSIKRLDELNFNFDNWENNNLKASDRWSLDKYLFKQFSYASSLTLKRDLEEISINDVLPWDLIVQRRMGNKIWHVFVIMDVAEDKDGNKKVVLGQSNIPAQSFHVVRNPMKNLWWHNYKDEFSKKPFYAKLSSTILSLASLTMPSNPNKDEYHDYDYWYDLETLLMYSQSVPSGQWVLRRFSAL